MSEGRKSDSNRGLIILLSALCFVICGLIAGIIVVINNNKLVLNTCEDAIDYMFANSDMDSAQILIDAGNRALEVAPNEEVKWCVYSKRFGALYNYSLGGNKEYLSQLLSDAYMMEEIRGNAKTAYDVYTAEILVGNTEKAEEWLRIVEKRGGINMRGKG